MSFQQFQQRCEDCGEEWNAAFGVVGTTILAEAPQKCPKCGSANLKTIAHGWKITPILAHEYISTACHQKMHKVCRKTCKFCLKPCQCECHAEPRGEVK